MVEIDARINKYEARIATWFETQLRQPFLEFFSVVLRDIDNLIEGKDTEALRAAANNIGAFQQILLPIPNVPNLPPDNRNPQPFGMPLGV